MATRTLRTAASGHSDPTGLVQPLLDALNRIIVGKPHELKLSLACLLARGHLLIEDLPGVGKTTLAHALARVMDLSFQRVQFTSDLLPADVIGVSIFRRDTSKFEFHKGPIFSQLLLADEINRATPKAQSALLEAMEERQVTADGSTYELPSSSRHAIRRNRSARSRCPSRSSTASSCRSHSATPGPPKNASCWPTATGAISWANCRHS